MTCLVVCAGLGAGCSKILGLEDPTLRSDGGVEDGGIAGDAAGPDAGVGTMTLTHTGLTSVGPEGASAGALRILDPRFERGETVCTTEQLCINGGITP